MLNEIVAHFSCDSCGAEFSVTVDPAYTPPADWSIFDVAEDAVRGGLGYDPKKPRTNGYICMVDNDQHLCGDCAGVVCQKDQANV